ncbi:MAG: N-acetyltransferase family protein [Thermodesulfobacteriota bacterium]
MEIQFSTAGDKHRIVEIYNQAVAEGLRCADTVPVTLEEKTGWLELHSNDHYPIFVARKDGLVVGWCSLSPYRQGRKALFRVAEISYYIDAAHRRCGIGSRLIEHALENAADLGLSFFLAILLDLNHDSIRLLERHGFKKWGHLPEIADFGHTVCGQVIYGRKV